MVVNYVNQVKDFIQLLIILLNVQYLIRQNFITSPLIKFNYKKDFGDQIYYQI